MVLDNILDIKLIEKKDNIETYEGNMKIKIKKLIIANEYELYYFKSILKYKKIYDLIKDDNILYIYYDINENIDDIVNQSEHKEAKINCGAINKEEILSLFEKEDSMCKIESQKIQNGKLENILGNGFFLELNDEDIPFKKCLITNNHILNENDIKINEKINLEYRNEPKKIEITKDRKVYTNTKLDYTCIEIFDEDEIKQYFKIDSYIIRNSIEIYKEKDIFILHYPTINRNKITFSNGIILGIQDNRIIHNCSTYDGSSGSPLISRYSDNSIIGLHFGTYKNINLSTNIISIFDEIKKEIKKKISYNNILNYCTININKKKIIVIII